LYATGGLAYGGAYQNNFLTYALQEGANINGTVYIPTQNSTQKLLVGWTAGGGAEWKFMQNWSIKGEALYYDLGSLSVSNLTYYPGNGFAGINPAGGSTTLAYYSGILSRLGVNYHFNFASTPVVAKF
jgi:outer membrane immunogenic protein